MFFWQVSVLLEVEVIVGVTVDWLQFLPHITVLVETIVLKGQTVSWSLYIYVCCFFF